jgi:hypothetical protein
VARRSRNESFADFEPSLAIFTRQRGIDGGPLLHSQDAWGENDVGIRSVLTRWQGFVA